MLMSILVGLVLTLITVGIHAVGTTWWIERLKRAGSELAQSNRSWLTMVPLLGSTAVVLLLLHITEVTLWATTFCFLPGLTEINSFEEAVYFSTVTFTTLGYGDIVIEGPWRLLAAIEAMCGILIFGWSTALLFAIVQKILQSKESDHS